MISLKILDFNNYKKTFLNDNILIQVLYDDTIFNTDINDIKCLCNSNNWHFHAYYDRTIIIYAHKYKIRVLRIKCTNCNTTHVLLPIFIIPYFRKAIIEFNYATDELFFIKSIIRDNINWIIYTPT